MKKLTRSASVFLCVTAVFVCVLCAFSFSGKLSFKENYSVYTLSKLGSQGDEVKRIQKKLKNVDRNELLNMLSGLDLSKQNVDLEKLIENADIENIIKRL